MHSFPIVYRPCTLCIRIRSQSASSLLAESSSTLRLRRTSNARIDNTVKTSTLQAIRAVSSQHVSTALTAMEGHKPTDVDRMVTESKSRSTSSESPQPTQVLLVHQQPTPTDPSVPAPSNRLSRPKQNSEMERRRFDESEKERTLSASSRSYFSLAAF